MKRFAISARLNKLYLSRRVMLNKQAMAAGLYIGQLPVLEDIRHHDGCTQQDIARRLQVSPATIAVSTKRMQKAGLIEKKVDESNLRCNSLHVTERGWAYAEQARALFNASDRQLLAGFSNAEMDTLTGYLDRMIKNITGEEEINLNMHEILELQKQERSIDRL